MPDSRDGITPQLCPGCGVKLDAATIMEKGEPVELRPDVGDMSVCVYCELPLVFSIARVWEPAAVDELEPGERAQLDQVTSLVKHFKRDNPGAFDRA